MSLWMHLKMSIYGAVFYLRVEYKGDKVSLSFVTSNARVTPLCSISISHLKLMGAVIGKKLALSIYRRHIGY